MAYSYRTALGGLALLCVGCEAPGERRFLFLHLYDAHGPYRVRIPFVLHGPGIDAARVDGIVETVDLLPTVLDLLGVEPPPGLDRNRAIHTVRSRRWKLVVYPALDGDRIRLFDLATDSGELEDVGDRHPRIRDGLLAELAKWSAGEMAPAEEIELTPEDVENLKALGYLN